VRQRKQPDDNSRLTHHHVIKQTQTQTPVETPNARPGEPTSHSIQPPPRPLSLDMPHHGPTSPKTHALPSTCHITAQCEPGQFKPHHNTPLKNHRPPSCPLYPMLQPNEGDNGDDFKGGRQRGTQCQPRRQDEANKADEGADIKWYEGRPPPAPVPFAPSLDTLSAPASFAASNICSTPRRPPQLILGHHHLPHPLLRHRTHVRPHIDPPAFLATHPGTPNPPL